MEEEEERRRRLGQQEAEKFLMLLQVCRVYTPTLLFVGPKLILVLPPFRNIKCFSFVKLVYLDIF
jgi:hypothetical protein